MIHYILVPTTLTGQRCFLDVLNIIGLLLLTVTRELKYQMFMVPRTPTGSIFAAWQPLRMSRRSWAAVMGFKTRVLTLKPEVQIPCSPKSVRHTKVEIFIWNHVFFVIKKQNVTQIFERHFQLNYSVGVRDGFTLFCLMSCIWHAKRVLDPVLRGQPCRSWIKNVWCLSSPLTFRQPVR